MANLWLTQELQELRNAKIAALAILVAGLSAGWVAASAFYSQQIAVQAVQISALQDSIASQRPVPSAVFDVALSRPYVIGVSVAAAVLLLILAVLFWPKKKTLARENVTGLRVLERYYMSLQSIRDDVRRMKNIEELLPEKKHALRYHDVWSAVEKIRKELIDMSPELFPVSDAMELQQPPNENRAMLTEDRLPLEIDWLMDKIHRRWSRRAEKIGVEPIKFKNSPVVKLDDEA